MPGAAISTWLGFPERGRPVLASLLCGGLLTMLGVLTARECRKYHDSESLWRRTLARNPGAWMAHNNLGAELMHAGRIEEAVAQFQESLELQPDNVAAHTNLGYGLMQLGRADEALAHYNDALDIDPHDDAAHANLGAALLQLGRIEEAVPTFEGRCKRTRASPRRGSISGAPFCRRAAPTRLWPCSKGPSRPTPAISQPSPSWAPPMRRRGS